MNPNTHIQWKKSFKVAHAALSFWGRMHRQDREREGPALSIPETSKGYVTPPYGTPEEPPPPPDYEWFERIDSAVNEINIGQGAILRSVFISENKPQDSRIFEHAVHRFWMAYLTQRDKAKGIWGR